MSETKKRNYRRATAAKAVQDLIPQLQDINGGTADYDYLNKIRDVIIFGSFTNKDCEYVHDVDICIIHDDDREKMFEFHHRHPHMFSTFTDDIFAEYLLKEKYLRGRKSIYSFHSNISEGAGIIDIATKNAHFYLVKDYKICPDAGERIAQYSALGNH